MPFLLLLAIADDALGLILLGLHRVRDRMARHRRGRMCDRHRITVALFFYTAAFPPADLLNQTKMGALLVAGGVALIVVRLLRVGRFQAVERRVTRTTPGDVC